MSRRDDTSGYRFRVGGHELTAGLIHQRRLAGGEDIHLFEIALQLA